MRTYIVMGDIDNLEKLVEEKEIEIGFRSEHLPLVEIRTKMHEEEVYELLSDYEITPEKTYEVPE